MRVCTDKGTPGRYEATNYLKGENGKKYGLVEVTNMAIISTSKSTSGKITTITTTRLLEDNSVCKYKMPKQIKIENSPTGNWIDPAANGGAAGAVPFKEVRGEFVRPDGTKLKDVDLVQEKKNMFKFKTAEQKKKEAEELKKTSQNLANSRDAMNARKVYKDRGFGEEYDAGPMYGGKHKCPLDKPFLEYGYKLNFATGIT